MAAAWVLVQWDDESGSNFDFVERGRLAEMPTSSGPRSVPGKDRTALIVRAQSGELTDDPGGVEFDAGTKVQTWEGKPKSMLTWEERVAIGATPLGNYASKLRPRWFLVGKALERRGDRALAREVASLRHMLLSTLDGSAEHVPESEIQAKQSSILERLRGLNLKISPGMGVADIERIMADYLRDNLAGIRVIGDDL